MLHPIKRTTVIYSAAGVLAAAVLAASFVARLYFLRRRKPGNAPAEDDSMDRDEPGIVEEMVAHNWRGF